MSEADIALVWISTALVFVMTPGLAFFYGGLLRKKNVLSMMAKNFVIVSLVSMVWFVCAYSLGFASGTGFIGGLQDMGLLSPSLMNANPAYIGIAPSSIPELLYMAFQLMFAIITVAIILSAFAERVKFSTLCVFVVAWLILVYCPVAHWVWGGDGWLRNLANYIPGVITTTGNASTGALDFAGGTVVHVNSGFAALAVALVIGPRKNYRKEPTAPPYSVPYVLLGLALLWMGWFGFNGGSALAANTQAIQAMINTHLAACTAGFTWMCIGWKQTGKASVIGFASGALAGLVAITPAAGYVPIWSSLVIGLGAGFLCYFTLWFRNNRMKVDESLDAWAVHGCGGIWGSIATGIFAGAFGYLGLLTGSPGQLLFQVIDFSVTMVYSFCVTYALAWILHHTMGLRVKEEEEYVGLDISQHGETL